MLKTPVWENSPVQKPQKGDVLSGHKIRGNGKPSQKKFNPRGEKEEKFPNPWKKKKWRPRKTQKGNALKDRRKKGALKTREKWGKKPPPPG